MNNESFKPCIIIPVYNHHQQIEGICQAITEKNLTCFLVDDGSEENCANILVSISNRFNNTQLLRLDPNQGKGVAVCRGLQLAYQQSFTHALQIDADGQHPLGDMDKFLSMATQFPNAVISGWRPYRDLPRQRRYGRMVTDVWVWIHTLSLSIKDSMCGFRLYPLAATSQLIDTSSIGKRMDFDTDILVKLFWRGIKVHHVVIAVKYEDDIASHFDLVKDNIRVSKMHTKLFFGMLLRLPRLLYRNITGH